MVQSDPPHVDACTTAAVVAATRMNLDRELEAQLILRIREQVSCEASGDVEALYNFIDPAIRSSRAAQYAFEPDRTLSQLRAFVKSIRSANCERIEIVSFSSDGGEARDRRATAVAFVTVLYNGRHRSRFRTPWVLDEGLWYTRALAKLGDLEGT